MTEQGWEDTQTLITTGTENVYRASWYLAESRIVAVLGSWRSAPFALGIILALIVALAVVLSPSTDSHFIYTDF